VILLLGFAVGLNAQPAAFVLYPLERVRQIAAGDILQLVFFTAIALWLIPLYGASVPHSPFSCVSSSGPPDRDLRHAGIAMNAGQLKDTRAAFDSVAAAYTVHSVTTTRAMAARQDPCRSGTVGLFGRRVLDLGCGPDSTPCPWRGQGYRVTAIDWSAQMVRRTQERAVQAGVDGGLAIHHLGIHELERLPTG